jgi:hypothetical protein
MKELWLPIPEYEDSYEVSSYGRVRTLGRIIRVPSKNGGYFNRYLNGRIRIPGCTRGYYFIPMSRNGKAKNQSVHRLVAKAFLPNPTGKREVNHKNGNKLDNRVENLQWVTPKENGEHASENGLLGRVTLIQFNGKTQSLCKWAKEIGVKRSTLSGRLNRSKMTVREALTLSTEQGIHKKDKLTPSKMKTVHRLLKSGLSIPKIAERLGVCFQSIYLALKRIPS